MTAIPSPALLAALEQLDGCMVANAIEAFRARLRNEGFTNGSIRSVFPDLPPAVGYAATIRIRAASPPISGLSYSERTDWWDYVLSVPAPRLLVVQDVSSQPGLGALLGEVHVNILMALGCRGAVTNGSVRDLPAVANVRFPLFSGSLSVSHSYVHIVEMGTPVEIGGLAVRSGDLLHADRHGVQSIPLAVAANLPAEAARQTARERPLIDLCRARPFSIERLKEFVSTRRS